MPDGSHERKVRNGGDLLIQKWAPVRFIKLGSEVPKLLGRLQVACRSCASHVSQRAMFGIKVEYTECFRSTLPCVRRKSILWDDGSITDEHQEIVRIINVRLQYVRMVVWAATILVLAAGVPPIA